MEQKMVSVIVPVYNSGTYLKKALDALLAQTYKAIEIILIDDGSTDGSIEVCKEYEEKYPNIKFFSQQHKGVSGARNNGLKHASGDYIGFIDSDDYLTNNMFELLVENLEKAEADICVCGHFVEQDHQIKEEVKASKLTCYTRDEFQKCLIEDKEIKSYLWDKLFKKELFHQVVFSGNIFEDAKVLHEVVDRSEKIVQIPECLYYYVLHQGSLTHYESKEHWYESSKILINCLIKRYEHFSIGDRKRLKACALSSLVPYLYEGIKLGTIYEEEEIVASYVAFLKEHKSEMKENEFISKKDKMILAIYCGPKAIRKLYIQVKK